MATLQTDKYDLPRLLKFQSQMRRVAETLSRAISHVEESGDPLWVFKAKSQELGIDRLLAFEQELDTAVISAKSGLPHTSTTQKSRAKSEPSTAPKKSVPNIPHMRRASDMAAEQPDDSQLEQDAVRAAKRAVAKDEAKRPAAKGGRKKKSG